MILLGGTEARVSQVVGGEQENGYGIVLRKYGFMGAWTNLRTSLTARKTGNGGCRCVLATEI